MGVSPPQGLFLPPRTSTLFVAAANATALERAQADRICGGVNDHIEIQEMLDALPATGGSVCLSSGTFNIEVSLVLDSYQTLRGCGRNSILTTTTANLDIITATGGAGSELVGILLADFCVDGNAGGVVNDVGILWSYVDYSDIVNVWSINNGENGISLTNCDWNKLSDCICKDNVTANYNGIYLYASCHNIIAENRCPGNDFGIFLEVSDHNTVEGNVCNSNGDTGIHIEDGDDNTVTGNTCNSNTEHGIYNYGSRITISGNTCNSNGFRGINLESSVYDSTISGNTCDNNTLDGIYATCCYNTNVSLNTCNNNGEYGMRCSLERCNVSGNNCCHNYKHGIYLTGVVDTVVDANTCIGNSQDTDITYDNINLNNADQCLISNNVCRQHNLANKPRYGINIDASSARNQVQGNDLYSAGKTANFNDVGTLTHVEDNNRGIRIDQIKMFRQMKNTSGAQRVAGDVVSLKAVAAGNEVTAPAAIGERQVYGMVAETIADAAWGLVQVKGKTTALKGTNVGGGNIVIGDNLITENGVRARKAAAATDPIFARALEALAAADGVIDAYICSPWD